MAGGTRRHRLITAGYVRPSVRELRAGGFGQTARPACTIKPFEELHGGDVCVLFGLGNVILWRCCGIVVCASAKAYRRHTQLRGMVRLLG
jgi:hypothetical protein